MGVTWFLAFRYFRGNRTGTRFLSFIKIMTIVGVIVGSGGLLIALSIVHGFKSAINEKIVGFAPHITVHAFGDNTIFRADTLSTFLMSFPEVRVVQPVLENQVMIQTKNEVSGILLKGVPPESVSEVTALKDYIAEGTLNLENTENGFPGIVLGSKTAELLQVNIGGIVTVYTITGLPSSVNSPEVIQFRVTGLYKTGIDRFDDLYAYVDRRHTERLFFKSMSEADFLEVSLLPAADIRAFKLALREELPFPYYNATVYENHANIYAWVELQEKTIPFVISVMVIIAAFNLIGAVLMMVLVRTKDIGILKTMGTSSRKIRTVFLMEGLLVAGVGLLGGILLAAGFNWVQANFGIIPLSQENYYMSTAPVDPMFIDFVIVSVVTVILCGLASYLPARIAASVNPLNIITYGR